MNNNLKTGDIVTCKEYYFSDGVQDSKKNRPLLFLFEYVRDDTSFSCVCPFTSQIKTFNRHHNDYWLLPEALYQQKKFSFLHLESINFVRSECLENTSLSINTTYIPTILNKIKEHLKDNIEHDIIQYYILFNKLEEKEQVKKKREAKTQYRKLQKSQQN